MSVANTGQRSTRSSGRPGSVVGTRVPDVRQLELDALCRLVDSFAYEMKFVLTRSQRGGKSGWDDPDNVEPMSFRAITNLVRGSFADVGIYAMFLWWHGLGDARRTETLGGRACKFTPKERR